MTPKLRMNCLEVRFEGTFGHAYPSLDSDGQRKTARRRLTSMCRFTSIIHKEEDGTYSAEVPLLPGCYTCGDTIDEVKANLKEAIELYLEVEADSIDATKLPNGSQLLEVAL